MPAGLLALHLMQKFLVIQTAFIGDTVLATALVEKLHQFYPDAKIDFVVRKGNESLFIQHPFLNEVLVWGKNANKYRNLFSVLKSIRNNKYDIVINSQRFAATGFLTVFSGAKETVGFDKNPWSFLFSKKVTHIVGIGNSHLHEVQRNQRLIEDITDAIAAKPRLYPTQKDYEDIKRYQTSPYISVAPASVWFTKQYPFEKWISLLDNMLTDMTVYLLGAPGDHSLCEAIKTGTTHRGVINLAGKLNFLQSAALQQSAVMNYVNDSAPMHFASAVNAPVTAVYCSTVPSFGFGPLSDRSFIVQTNDFLHCKPCGLHGYKACPLGHFKCAYTIDNQQLLSVLQE